MATFEKLSTGKVLFTDNDGKMFGLSEGSYILPLASDPNKIIISTTPIPNESDKGIRIDVDSVTLPVHVGRNDLVGQLSLDYFNSSSGGGGGTSDVNIVSPTNLATEPKQDDQIAQLAAIFAQMLERNRVDIGQYELNTSAWGEPITAQKYKLSDGLFTFNVDATKYKRMDSDVEVRNGSLDGYIRAVSGRLEVSADTLGQQHTLRTARAYRYQPDCGHIYSDSAWIPNAGNGTLYMVIRNQPTDTVSDERLPASTTIDITKGNVYDIQFQWRGAGNYKAFGNLNRMVYSEKLGTTTELTITNPSFPVFFEAVKGGHTQGGVTRTGSAVRWGLGTPENGVFFEWEYEDDRDPLLQIGCWNVSSEGGTKAGLTFGSILTNNISSAGGEQPALAIRVPTTRNVNGVDWINTLSINMASFLFGQKDESFPRIYITREPSAINLVAGSWKPDNLTDSCEYILNINNDAANTFTFNSALALLVFGVNVEIDQPVEFKNPSPDRFDLWINPGDYLIFTHETSGTDDISITALFGAEK